MTTLGNNLVIVCNNVPHATLLRMVADSLPKPDPLTGWRPKVWGEPGGLNQVGDNSLTKALPRFVSRPAH